MLRLFILSIFLGASLASAQTDAKGVWKGAIEIPGSPMQMTVALSQESGAWRGDITIPGQGQMPLIGIEIEEKRVRFGMQVPGNPRFDGSISDDNKGIRGTFRQGPGTFPFRLERTDEAVPPPSAEIAGVPGAGFAGVWLGKLGGLRLLARLVQNGEDLGGTLDSLDQGANGLQITKVEIKGQHIRFELTRPRAAFEGDLSADGSQLTGKWIQGAETPLTFYRQAGEPKAAVRPQEPTEPYPYKAEDVAYRNEAAGIQLAGTLTIPMGNGPFPAALLLSGSGAQDRDESLMGHRPFLVLADHLTRHGIAVLRVDDRGVGGSTGNILQSTTEDFAKDALVGVQFLQSRSDIAVNSIGLIGHSEGALSAMLAAAESDSVAYIVLLGGAAKSGEEIVESQIKLLSHNAGMSDEVIQSNLKVQRQLIQILREESDNTAARERIRALLAGTTEAQIAQAMTTLNPWSRFFFTYEPRMALARVHVPVLALWGEKDTQVLATENLPLMQQTLEQAGNKDFKLQVFDNLNHLFQTSQTGMVDEYSQIEETFAPVALTTISGWISARTS